MFVETGVSDKDSQQWQSGENAEETTVTSKKGRDDKCGLQTSVKCEV